MSLRVKSPDPNESVGKVIWLTGLSGSGKSTVAEALVKILKNRDLPVEHLDGDQIRQIFPQTGFDRQERLEHLRRIGFWASRLEAHGVYVVTSFISPYAEARQNARQFCQNFYEIYLSTPLAECERRDPKGLYARARGGQLKSMTGIDDQYEVPTQPNLTLDTTNLKPEKAAEMILGLLFPE